MTCTSQTTRHGPTSSSILTGSLDPRLSRPIPILPLRRSTPTCTHVPDSPHNSTSTSPQPAPPPPLIHAKSPYCRVPLPPQVENKRLVLVNPILQFTDRPTADYDLSLPPSSNILVRSRVLALLGYATSPPLPSLTIVTPLLPWAITVHPTNASGFVTVIDVLNSIHQELCRGITEREFNDLSSSYTTRSIWGRSSERQGRARGGYRTGAMRLHFLGGRNKFLGLSQSSMGPDTWILNVE